MRNRRRSGIVVLSSAAALALMIDPGSLRSDPSTSADPLGAAAPARDRQALRSMVDDADAALEDRRFADAIERWNDDIFWAPASASSKVITRFGDEARAVFGPIPEGNCAEGVAIPLEVDGHVVDLEPNPEKPSRPLEFAHRDTAGKVVKWTTRVPKCDKPSLAGNVTFCGLNSRLNRVVDGHVEWLFFCRKSSDNLEVRNDPYWLKSTPEFRRFGTIGFNHRTGEIVFFDGRKDRQTFDWSTPFMPPGGRSYEDTAGRAAAEDLYDPTFEIQCSQCHDNKNPYVVDPHARQARVGYRGGEGAPRAIAFSLGDYLPETPRIEGSPFRVIGTGYTTAFQGDLMRARTVRDPTGNCTTCHTLTTQITGQRFAADAVGLEPWISNPTWGQVLMRKDEELKLALIANHRTDWAQRSGLGKIHPWMVPGQGNDLRSQSPGLSEAAWRELSDCLWGEGGPECGYRPLYTPCLPPQPDAQGDGSKPLDIRLSVLPPPAGEQHHDQMLQVTWRYLNSYGGVPTRDDVRFDLAIKEAPIPPGGRPSAPSDYPTMKETAVLDLPDSNAVSGRSGSIGLVKNASYLGHARWTDPTPATGPRDYRVKLPAACGSRHLVRVLPKRFCFDQSNIAYSTEDYLLSADVTCD